MADGTERSSADEIAARWITHDELIDALQAERGRYRAALEAIGGDLCMLHPATCIEKKRKMPCRSCIARRALGLLHADEGEG